MSISTLWWIACGAAVGVELLTGTFYLLMLALGLAAAAMAAHFDADTVTQLTSAALVGGIGIGALYAKRSKEPIALGASTNKDVNLDIGETVHVLDWDIERNCTVHYRGVTLAFAPLGRSVVLECFMQPPRLAEACHRLLHGSQSYC